MMNNCGLCYGWVMLEIVFPHKGVVTRDMDVKLADLELQSNATSHVDCWWITANQLSELKLFEYSCCNYYWLIVFYQLDFIESITKCCVTMCETESKLSYAA